jgi:acetyl-CoA synthetase
MDTVTSRTDDAGAGFELEVAWTPGEPHLSRSRLKKLMAKHNMATYDEFLERSVMDPDWFWTALDEDLELAWMRRFSKVLDTSDGVQWPHWFVDGQFNYVENCVDRHALGELADELAIIWVGDDGGEAGLSYRDLYEAVNRFAAGLLELGVDKGDRIGLFMPMLPETAIALFACGRIGALAIPAFSGYGPEAVASRLRDAEARILICADGFYRRGRTIRMKEIADQAVRQSPSVDHVIVVKRTGGDIPWRSDRDVWWHELEAGRPNDMDPVETDANDPCMIIYTSGTTGRPKGALHVHAGFPLKAAQDMALLFDVQTGDRLFWLTDIGWMMGPWAIMGTTMLGGTVVLFEGVPDYPSADRLWEIVASYGVTHLGIAPTVVRALMAHGDELPQQHDLSSLLVLGASGEPWNLGPWRWYFDVIGQGRLPIINYSGGTETSGGILGCNTILPMKPMSFTTAVPGMDAAVFNDAGDSVRDAVGELVLRRPWVGMTHGFWRDNDRYLETYWSRWQGVWAHGDWAIHHSGDDGAWFILGRSDDTLKIAGKRLGPSEVETAACSHPAVLEAAAIGVPDELKGEVVHIFVVVRLDRTETDDIRSEIREVVGKHLGKALAPSKVLFVSDLPKTRNAKIMRRVIRAKHLGVDLGDISSLENPAAVEEIGRAR